jgi:L-ribulose-5-phosphate 4-epimerase
MDIRKEVLDANRWIVEKGLVKLTWGNVSGLVDNKIVIKPSGINLDAATPADMSVLTERMQHLTGGRPSVDTPTHVEIYNLFPKVKAIVHTHSKYSTIFAQANKPIPCLGTTHADYFYGEIPCVEHPSKKQIIESYEESTGKIIGEYFHKNGINYLHVPGCLVRNHGVFTWGETIEKALETAYVLELIAEMAYKTLLLDPNASMQDYVLEKHYSRKNGSEKYYGQ